MTEREQAYRSNEKLVLELALAGLRANFQHEEARLLERISELDPGKS